MRILILGAGKMGSFFADLLSFEHEVAIYDTDQTKLRFIYNTYRFSTKEDIATFNPELVLNAVTLKHTISAFKEVIPVLSTHCILSDIASVKSDLKEFYINQSRPYISTHPMFGPTFATLSNLAQENAIIIRGGDLRGECFFKKLYNKLNLSIFFASFEEHDQAATYALATPFMATFAFLAALKTPQAPGTTYKKHEQIAQGVMNEDNFLIQEILFNSDSVKQINLIIENMENLKKIINQKDAKGMATYLNALREHL